MLITLRLTKRWLQLLVPETFQAEVLTLQMLALVQNAIHTICSQMQKQKHFEMTQEFMVGHFKNGRAAIRSAIEELESHGFLKRIKHRVGSKDIYDYVISEHILEGEKWEFENGHPKMGVRKSAAHNRTQRYNINKVINNKEIPE